MEAELQRFCGVDYRDRWRFDEHGRRRLTLRRVFRLFQGFPETESRLVWLLVNDGQPIWPVTAHIVDDLRIAMTSDKKRQSPPHPARFSKKKVRSGWGDPKRIRSLMAARQRARARRLQLAGEEEA